LCTKRRTEREREEEKREMERWDAFGLMGVVVVMLAGCIF
jgi:hypothetical protein